MVWPASIVRIDAALPGQKFDFGLHRADGAAVSADAAQRGRTGIALDPPWVGSPLVVRFDAAIPARAKVNPAANLRGRTMQPGPRAGGGRHEVDMRPVRLRERDERRAVARAHAPRARAHTCCTEESLV